MWFCIYYGYVVRVGFWTFLVEKGFVDFYVVFLWCPIDTLIFICTTLGPSLYRRYHFEVLVLMSITFFSVVFFCLL